MERVIDVRQPLVDARGRLVDLGRTFHVQRFVRTFVVEDVDKFVKAGLLLKEIRGRRLGGLFFQREMPAFVTPVLLRMGGFDPFDTNAQGQHPPPHFLKLNKAWCEGDGSPFSLGILAGSPRSLKSRSNTVKA